MHTFVSSGLPTVCGFVFYALVMKRNRWAQSHLPQIILCTFVVTFLSAFASLVVCPGFLHKLFSALICLFLFRFILIFAPFARGERAMDQRISQ